MSKADEILERNRQRREQGAQQGDKPESATGVLERILFGGVHLALWVLMLIVAVWVFGFSTFVGIVIFGDWINGVILGAVVTFGGGYVLYKLGRYFY